MDDAEDDSRYLPSPYGSSNRQKLPMRNVSYSRPDDNQYVDEEEDDEDIEENGEVELGEEDGENNQINGIRFTGQDDVSDYGDDEDEEDHYVDEVGEDDEDNNQKNYSPGMDDADMERHPKKRKVKSLASSYEFAPRVPPPPPPPPPVASKPSFSGRNPLTDWTEHETFVLLVAWGDKFLQHGRKSLRSEEWHEVAEKVSEMSKIERTDSQCRNRLDTLKKKYKKEKVKLAETGAISSWVYFKKMDALMSTPAQHGGLSCGLDSGEHVLMNPRVYLNRETGRDEMRDSPGNSESAGENGDDSEGLPPKKRRSGRDHNGGSSFRLLADSIHKLSEIYEKIEQNKRQQMFELEKMRMDFHRELEIQKRQILERAQAEIARIRQSDDDENYISPDNASG